VGFAESSARTKIKLIGRKKRTNFKEKIMEHKFCATPGFFS